MSKYLEMEIAVFFLVLPLEEEEDDDDVDRAEAACEETISIGRTA